MRGAAGKAASKAASKATSRADSKLVAKAKAAAEAKARAAAEAEAQAVTAAATTIQALARRRAACERSNFERRKRYERIAAAQRAVQEQHALLGQAADGHVKESLRLVELAGDGELDQVKELLKATAEVSIEDEDAEGSTALSEAACLGEKDMVSFLVHSGADPNTENCLGRTPLWRAAYNGHDEIVLILLQAGAIPTKADVEGRTPGNLGPPGSKARDAIEAWDIEETKRLLELRDRRKVARGAGLDFGAMARQVGLGERTTDQPRDKALLYCIVVAGMKGNEAALRLILDEIMPPSNQRPNYVLNRWTLHPGATTKEYLVPGRALVTPLVAAAAAGEVGCARLLIDRGAVVDRPLPRTYLTALHLAAARGHPDCVRLLLERGASAFLRSRLGATAYEMAVGETARQLLASADPLHSRVVGDDDNQSVQSRRHPGGGGGSGGRGSGRDEQTKELFGMSASEIREGGAKYQGLLEARELNSVFKQMSD